MRQKASICDIISNMSSLGLSNTIQFKVGDSHTLSLKNFGFEKLKTAVNGKRNIGELRFSLDDGQIHKINNHDIMTWKNHTVTTGNENLVTRNAILAILETKYELDVHLGDIFKAIKEKLVGKTDLHKPISRDEVRLMIDLLESESKVARTMESAPNAGKIKDYLLTPGQIKAKLDLSQRLKTCDPAVREAWMKHHGGEIKDYIKGWGKSKVLNTVSDNVKAYYREGDYFAGLRYDPTISPSPNQAQNPPPAAPAQQQQVANNPQENDAPVSEIDLINARKTVKDSIVTKKNKLMTSIREKLNEIDFTKHFDPQSYIQFKKSAQGHLTKALGQINSLSDWNAKWGNLLKSKLTEKFCDVDGKTVSDAKLKTFLNGITGKIIENRLLKALDRLLDQCTTAEELKSVETKYAALFDALDGESQDFEQKFEQLCAAMVKVGLDLFQLFSLEHKSSQLFDLNLFGRLDLQKVFQNSFSALEKWASILTDNIDSWTSAIESKHGPGSLDEQFNRHVLSPETFMRFSAAESEESLATEETQQYENAAHLTVDTLHAGKPGEARKVGLHIDKLNLDKATIKQLDGLGFYSTIILGNDLAFRIVIDKLKSEHPDLALKVLKSLVNAHRVVRPRKQVPAINGSGMEYKYIAPANFNPIQAMDQAQKILETHEEYREEKLTVGRRKQEDEDFESIMPQGDITWEKLDAHLNKKMTKVQADEILDEMQATRQEMQGDFSKGTDLDNQRLDMSSEIAKMVELFSVSNILKLSPENLANELEDLGNSWKNKNNGNLFDNIGNIG